MGTGYMERWDEIRIYMKWRARENMITRKSQIEG
jgi:hypothetical protein